MNFVFRSKKPTNFSIFNKQTTDLIKIFDQQYNKQKEENEKTNNHNEAIKKYQTIIRRNKDKKKNTENMMFIFMCIAICAPILCCYYCSNKYNIGNTRTENIRQNYNKIFLFS